MSQMNELKELAKIVTRSGLKKIDSLLSDNAKSNKRYKEVAYKIANAEFSTEEDIARFFGTVPGSGQYRVFKSRLKEKLLNSVLLLDVNEQNTVVFSRTGISEHRNIYCIRILLSSGAPQTAIALTKSTMRQAAKREMWTVCTYCASVLTRLFSYMGNVTDFNRYDYMQRKYMEYENAQYEARRCLFLVNTTMVNTNTFNSKQLGFVLQNLQKATVLFEKYNFYGIGTCYYRIRGMYEVITHNYIAALNTWQLFENFRHKDKTYDRSIESGECALQQLYCYLCLRDYKNGETAALKCDKFFKAQSINWFLSREMLFQLAIHTQNYNQVAEILELVVSSPNYRVLDPNRQEKWKIFEAFNYILQRARHENEQGKQYKSKFRLSSFLNSVPIHNKDKQGFNIRIFFAQIMILLLDHKYEKLSDVIESLKRYDKRHFAKTPYHRSRTFTKMLIIADQCEYKKELTLSKTAALQEKLKVFARTPPDSYEDLEIVPYIDLWEIALDCLKKDN
jgi:hypothetical protein